MPEPNQAPPATPAPEKKKDRYDGLAPLFVPEAVCANCGGKMAFAPTRDAKGKILKWLYFCDFKDCEYGFEFRPEHLTGTIVKFVPAYNRRQRPVSE